MEEHANYAVNFIEATRLIKVYFLVCFLFTFEFLIIPVFNEKNRKLENFFRNKILETKNLKKFS